MSSARCAESGGGGAHGEAERGVVERDGAREVEHAHELAEQVPHRRRVAEQGRVLFFEVRAADHRHGRALHDGRADGVGAAHGLAPLGALHQLEQRGSAREAGPARAMEHHAVGVGHHGHELPGAGVAGDGVEHGAPGVEHGLEALAACAELCARDALGVGRAVGAQAAPLYAQPALEQRVARAGAEVPCVEALPYVRARFVEHEHRCMVP
jgi:hypothetical protein